MLTAVGVALLVLALPAVSLLERQPRLVVSGLPGLRSTQPRPSLRLLRIGAGAVLLLVVTTLGLGWSPLALALVGIGDLGMAVIVARLRAELERRPSRRSALTAALAVYRPRFVVYTARRNDGSYQLAMWLPQLAKLDEPYLVVVRHQEAIAHARALTSAPVICCPAGADLDALLVPSLRAAFYVNGVSENTNFVLYRQLRHVYLGHGDSDKEMSVHPMHAMFDHVFVAGQAAIDRYAQSGVKIDHALFTVVGRPQLADLDRAADGSRTATATDAATPLRVLLAPTWRGYNAVSSVSSLPVADAVAAALVSAGAEIVFRPHPFSWLGAEQGQIEAVDDLLRADRAATGRAHRLAEENRGTSLLDNFAATDALVTDVGSVLVDYFATDKPYAVVLPGRLDPAEAPTFYPSTLAAHRISADAFGAPDRHRAEIAGWIDGLSSPEGTSTARAAVRRHFLGDRPGDDRPFLDAVRALLDQAPRELPGRLPAPPTSSTAAPGAAGLPGGSASTPARAAEEIDPEQWSDPTPDRVRERAGEASL